MKRVHRPANLQMIQHLGMGVHAQADIPKGIASCQLFEKQIQQMIVTTEAFDKSLIVSFHKLIELIAKNKFHDLRKHKLALIHDLML